MGLPMLLEIPSGSQGWNSFSFAHWTDHQEIHKAVQTQLLTNLFVYTIFPVDIEDQKARYWFLEWHQQMHDDVNALLKVAGNDLTGVDFNDPALRRAWSDLNFREHRDQRSALKI